ncbi:MAG: hypothetical protein OXF88_01365 [Rhodobacteraceae bacterium]|nr:hypothetical protein [Paracoccaceae bacterium]MCY4141052.1 hypothetical protein [Paracoccaceae bacterium]
MKTVEAIKVLWEWDRRGRAVFAVEDLRKMFPERSHKTFAEGLRRLVLQGFLERAARGVYVNSLSRLSKRYRIEEVAVCLRRGEYSYVSLESALAEYGAISQIPMSRITVMTTGRSAEIRTPYGVIEFTHTSRGERDILNSTIFMEGRPLRIARVEAALRDLRRVGRNLGMVNEEYYQEILEEQAAARIDSSNSVT